MSEPAAGSGREQRRSERVDFEGEVTVELQPVSLAGSGENISDQGVYLLAPGQLPVRVRVGAGEERTGVIVRLENIGDGRVGLAIRFDTPTPVTQP